MHASISRCLLSQFIKLLTVVLGADILKFKEFVSVVFRQRMKRMRLIGNVNLYENLMKCNEMKRYQPRDFYVHRLDNLTISFFK